LVPLAAEAAAPRKPPLPIVPQFFVKKTIAHTGETSPALGAQEQIHPFSHRFLSA